MTAASPPGPLRREPLPPEPRPSAGASWWDGIAPAHMSLVCGGTEHRLRWAEGRLTAADHPDADRERALVALGGEHVACLDLFDAWHGHTDDLDLLALAARGPSDRLPDPDPTEHVSYSGGYSKFGWTAFRTHSVAMANFRGSRGRMSQPAWTMSADSDDDGSAITASRLANLPGGLTDRLIATVIATWTDRLRTDDQRVAPALPRLQAALYGRILASLRSLGPHTGPLDLTLVAADAARSVTIADGRIRCRLPFSWLSEVWVKDLAAVLGRLCLAVETTRPNHLQLLVTDYTGQSQRIMTVDFADWPTTVGP